MPPKKQRPVYPVKVQAWGGKPEPAIKKRKDPNAPKRALGAYMYFVLENRERVKQKFEGCSFGEVGKHLGEEWRAMTDAKKGKYKKLHEKDKERYDKEMESYDGSCFIGNAKQMQQQQMLQDPSKKRKAKKDPNAPKRALGAYMYFVLENRERVKQKFEGCSFGEVGRHLGEEWREMGDKEKAKYTKLHEKDKLRYDREMEEYDGSCYIGNQMSFEMAPLPPPKKVKDPNAPKRALGAYMYFVLENRERVKQKYEGCSFGEVGKHLGEEWRAITDKNKAKYLKLHEKDKVRYERDMEAYAARNAQMQQADYGGGYVLNDEYM